MAKRQLELTEEQIQQFRSRENATRDVDELKRLQSVRLYGTGASMEDICTDIGTNENSIRQWAQHYRETGFEALRSKWCGKNAQKLNDEQRAELRERLHDKSPAEWEISEHEFWTVDDLQKAIQAWYDVVYQSRRSYTRLLHECGFSYQRAEKIYRSRASERDIAEFENELEKK